MAEEKKPKPSDYEWGQVLGEGAYGDVILATEIATGNQFAIKKMLKVHLAKEATKKFVMNERNVLSVCDHPNIVRLYKAFRDEDYFYYVLNLAPNGELLGQIRKTQGLHMDCVKFWSAEIICSLEYLHCTVGCIHRDLKPENVLLDANFHVLLTDFGTSKLIDKQEGRIARKGSFVGTAEYMPPELVKETKTCFASDLWSLGCTIYQMLCARPPFRGVTEYLTMQKVQEGMNAVAFPDPFPAVAKDLISMLLQLDPASRLGSDDYAALKAHAFFSGINWVDLHKQTVPPIRSIGSFRWQEDIMREEQERLEQERAKLREQWEKFLFKKPTEENIIESGMVIKARRLSHKKRFLILTDTPRLFYVDPKKKEFKGEVPWSADEQKFSVFVKDNINWQITIPNRVYYFEDLSKNAGRWKEIFEKLQSK